MIRAPERDARFKAKLEIKKKGRHLIDCGPHPDPVSTIQHPLSPMFPDLHPHELPLWRLVTAQFRLGRDSIHGPSHWLTVRRNGLYLATQHPADEEVVRLFAVFHDSCRENEHRDPQHGPRGARLAIDFREAGHFQLDDARM